MALDGAFLKLIKDEIISRADQARVDRISQPSRDEIVLGLRWRGGSGRLLISAGADSPRIHFTTAEIENPKSPPMFCMFLRKHLGGAKLIGARQIGMDRILHLVFETTNELGDVVQITLAVEIMGRHSNLIVIGQDNKVMDAIKRIDDTMSSVRQVLPGMSYALPPSQGKCSVLDTSAARIVELVRGGKDVELSKALMNILQGLSPLTAREIAYSVTHGREQRVSELDGEGFSRLEFYLDRLRNMLETGEITPTIVADPQGRPRDFSFMEIHQYGHAMVTRSFGTCSALLDTFYSERDLMERMKQRSNDLLKFLATASERISRKLVSQEEELQTCIQRDQLKRYGDLIQSNLYQIQKGDRAAKVVDFFDEAMPEIQIELDSKLTPAQNAQKYFHEYRKADTAEKKLRELIQKGREEQEYLDSVFDALVRARTASELNAIREELEQQRYVKRHSRGLGKGKTEKLPPLRYVSTDGFTILTGRNNVQNDQLTLRDSRNYDIWFHTQKIPGSHTIVVTDGKREVPNSTLEQAAVIAAYNSKARESTKVAVDYTYIKNVKKPNGAKPGMVIYETYETAIVTPDETLVKSLQAAP